MGKDPSDALRTLVDDERFRLVSISPQKIARMLGPALELSRIAAETYGSQKKGEPAIDTVKTRAILVTTTRLADADVEETTRAIFEGAAFLGTEGGAAALATEIPSLRLHPGAEAYYQEAGHLPAPEIEEESLREVLILLSVLFSLLVGLLGVYRGLLEFLRNHTRSGFARQMMAVPADADYTHTVRALSLIRDAFQERVTRGWWRPSHLDVGRFRELSEFLETRVGEARANLERSLLARIRTLRRGAEGDDEGRVRAELIREAILLHLESGELSSRQAELLITLLSSPLPSSSGGPQVSGEDRT